MQVEEIISTAGLQTKGTKSYKDSVHVQERTIGNDKPINTVNMDQVDLSETSLDMVNFEKTMESLQEYTGWGNFNINFATDDQTGSMIIKIIDRDTGEMLRQIPPEQILSLRSYIQGVLGLIFDHMA